MQKDSGFSEKAPGFSQQFLGTLCIKTIDSRQKLMLSNACGVEKFRCKFGALVL